MTDKKLSNQGKVAAILGTLTAGLAYYQRKKIAQWWETLKTQNRFLSTEIDMVDSCVVKLDVLISDLKTNFENLSNNQLDEIIHDMKSEMKTIRANLEIMKNTQQQQQNAMSSGLKI